MLPFDKYSSFVHKLKGVRFFEKINHFVLFSFESHMDQDRAQTHTYKGEHVGDMFSC